MSKIFKVSGNSRRNIPFFTGEIVVNDENIVYGYSYLPITEGEKALRYLVGTMTQSGEKNAIEFYEISNDLNLMPILYVVPDLTDAKSGKWIIDKYMGPESHKAIIVVEEQPYSEEAKEHIESLFNGINPDLHRNNVLLNQYRATVNA